ncbi:14262_t:CDS:2 [Gigaspora rosea]|nr:14262_t:CDS:2 [Gigaspora rosea]
MMSLKRKTVPENRNGARGGPMLTMCSIDRIPGWTSPCLSEIWTFGNNWPMLLSPSSSPLDSSLLKSF